MSHLLFRRSLTLAAALILTPAAFCNEVADILGEPPEVDFEGQSQELPLTQAADRFLVQVRIGDAGPYAFLIDTGASLSVVDNQIAADLELEVVGELAVGAPGGNQVTSERVLVPRMTVNGVNIEKLSPVVLDIAAMSSGLIQGVLGMDVFQNFTLTLDPFRKLATVSREPLVAGLPGVIEFDNSQGRMGFSIDVAGQSVPTQIDTGSPGSFTVPARFWDHLPTKSDTQRKRTARLVGGEREITVRQLDGRVSFAGLSYENPDVAVMDPSPHLGNIGGTILNRLIISVDHRNQLLSFRQPDEEIMKTASPVQRTQSKGGPRRLGVQFGGGPGKTLADVGHVDADSLGEQAGFKPGDTILSLNDKPMSTYGMAELGSTIRGDGVLRFVIERDDQEQVIEID